MEYLLEALAQKLAHRDPFEVVEDTHVCEAVGRLNPALHDEVHDPIGVQIKVPDKGYYVAKFNLLVGGVGELLALKYFDHELAVAFILVLEVAELVLKKVDIGVDLLAAPTELLRVYEPALGKGFFINLIEKDDALVRGKAVDQVLQELNE